MKYAWIKTQRRDYPLSALCSALTVSIGGYRSWKRGGKPDRTRLSDAQLVALMQAIHAELKGAYGSPRMILELRSRGFPAGKERVERLMRENGIRARHKRRYKATTDSRHALPIAPNVLERNFTPTAPNQVWSADMTYVWTDAGWLYLAIVRFPRKSRIFEHYIEARALGSRPSFEVDVGSGSQIVSLGAIPPALNSERPCVPTRRSSGP